MKQAMSFKVIISFLLLSMFMLSPASIFSQETTSKSSEPKRKNEIKVFGGVNFNYLNVTGDVFTSEMAPGYLLGASFKQGRFFYWEAGLRFNNTSFKIEDLLSQAASGETVEHKFSVQKIDIPISGGINILSATRRVLGVRVFVSAMPSFNLSVKDNGSGVTEENTNAFIFNGQVGAGLDVMFLFLEAGYNFGFSDLFKDDIKSTPSQVFVTLGFRF